MTQKEKQKIVDTLDSTRISNITLNQLIQDRNDFGFDSIYCRYAEVCDELAAYQSVVDHVPAHEARKRMNSRKAHFYMALEQFVHAHPKEGEDGTYC